MYHNNNFLHGMSWRIKSKLELETKIVKEILKAMCSYLFQTFKYGFIINYFTYNIVAEISIEKAIVAHL